MAALRVVMPPGVGCSDDRARVCRARRGGLPELPVLKIGLIRLVLFRLVLGWLVIGICGPQSIAAPGPLAEAGRALAGEAWAATIRAEVHESEGPARHDTLKAAYNPEGLVRLRLGVLDVEASPGRLVAKHRWNTRVVYIAEHEGAGIAEILAAELPPLWCPWLAIALAGGDAGAWPVVGQAGGRRIEFAHERPLTGPHAADVYSGRGVNTRAEVSVRLRDTPDAEDPDQTRVIPRLIAYAIALPRGSAETTIRFSARFHDLEKWPLSSTEGRVAVASVADLTPPPPEIGFGDRLPTLALSAVDGDDLAARPWRPGDVFDPGLPGRRPAALVLVVARPRPGAGGLLASAAETIRRARLQVAGVGVVARPIVATVTEEVDRDRLVALRGAWLEAYRPARAHPEVESRTPDIAWLPASSLLGRVSPGTDAALVVVDRGGWIVGVIPDMEGVEDLVEAIRRASR